MNLVPKPTRPILVLLGGSLGSFLKLNLSGTEVRLLIAADPEAEGGLKASF